MRTTVSRDFAQKVKMCSSAQIQMAVICGELETRNGDIVIGERFTAWAPPIRDYEIVSHLNDTRTHSKTIVETLNPHMIAQRHQSEMKGVGYDFVPVNPTNVHLLLTIQDGGHDGNVWCEDLHDELIYGMGQGKSYYQIRVHLARDQYRQGIHPGSLVATKLELSNRHRKRLNAVELSAYNGELTVANYGDVSVVLCDGAYRRWAKGHQTKPAAAAMMGMLFSPGLLRA